mgnify:CR=1 FL=1
MLFTLFAMVAGRLPWKAAADPAGRLTPISLTSLGVAVPAAVDDVLQDALSPEPTRRPPTAIELHRRLAAALDGQPSARPRKTESMNAIPAALVETVSGPSHELRRTEALAGEPPGPEPSPAPRGSVRPWQWAAALAGVAAIGGGIVVVATADEAPTTAKAEVEEARLEWDEPSASPSPSTTATKASTPVALPKREGDDSGFGDAPRHLPADAAFLMGVRWRVLRQTPMFADLFEQLVAHPEFAPLRMLDGACGIDVVDDTDWVVLGGGHGDDVDVVAAGAWTRESVEECFASFQDGGSIEHEGELTTFEAAGEVALGVVVSSQSTHRLDCPSPLGSILLKSTFSLNVPSADVKQPAGRSVLEMGEPSKVSAFPM